VALGVPHQSGHAGNDDDGGGAGGEAVFEAFLEEGEEGYGGEVDGGDVGVHDGGPALEGFGFPELFFQF